MVTARHVWVRLAAGLIVVTLAAWLIHTGYGKWQKSIAETNSCNNLATEVQQHFRYIQLIVENQSLRNPVFDGHYFLHLGKEFGKNSFDLKISQAGKRNFGTTAIRPQLAWDDGFEGLIIREPAKAEMSFVSQYHSHYMFPFDSARFDEALSFDPPIDIKSVLFSNRVAGFYMPCDTIKVHTEAGSANISFELKRNPLIVYSAVLLLIVAAFFAISISLFVEIGPLPGALASYFFAVWSIRLLFGLTAESFPTLFDIGILLLVLLIPLLLFLRILGLPQALAGC